jgi:hypothetical protein
MGGRGREYACPGAAGRLVSTWEKKLGYKLREIGEYMGISKQRVEVILRTDPKRIDRVLKGMKTGVAIDTISYKKGGRPKKVVVQS